MVSETEFWGRVAPLKTAYRRVVMAVLALIDGDYSLARERLGAAQTAIAWARDRGVIDAQTASRLHRLVGSRIDALERRAVVSSGYVEYVADRILLEICRLYAREVRRR